MGKTPSLYSKLTASFLVVVLITSCFALAQMLVIKNIDDNFLSYTNIHTRQDYELDLAKNAKEQIIDQVAGFQQNQPKDKTQKQAQLILAAVSTLKISETQYRNLTYNDDPDKTKISQLDTATSQLIDAASSIAAKISSGTSAVGLTQDTANLNQAALKLDSSIAKIETLERTKSEQKNTQLNTTIAILRNIIIGAAFSSGLIAFTAVRLITRWVSRPADALRIGAERISNGDFTQMVDESSKDFFGELAHTFNQMAERLRTSYQRLALRQQQDEAILQNMADGVLAVNQNSNVTLLNEVAVDLLGYDDAASILGRNTQTAFEIRMPNSKDPEPLKPALHPSYIALTTGKSVKETYQYSKPNGKKYLYNINANPIRLDEKVVGAVILFRDVTKEREIDRMKTEFISLASHQLRTPLSAIKWFTEMLIAGDAGKLQKEQLEFVTNVSDSTERMIQLVNSLLNISRIESGRIMITPVPTDLKKLVSGIVNDLKAKTKEKEQHLIISVNSELPKINLDPRLVSQVYMNLLTNAIKYTPKNGEITVLVSRKGNEIISQVSDNGYGIPKDQQKKVFQKFFRAPNTSQMVTEGTGLGLYLTKAVVDSSGGKIWFESVEGKGTTFWFSIPMTGMKAKEGEVTLES